MGLAERQQWIPTQQRKRSYRWRKQPTPSSPTTRRRTTTTSTWRFNKLGSTRFCKGTMELEDYLLSLYLFSQPILYVSLHYFIYISLSLSLFIYSMLTLFHFIHSFYTINSCLLNFTLSILITISLFAHFFGHDLFQTLLCISGLFSFYLFY